MHACNEVTKQGLVIYVALIGYSFRILAQICVNNFIYIGVRSAHCARNTLYSILPPFYRLPTKSDNQNIVQPAIIGILIKAYLFESLLLILNA